jgi:ATP-dependent Clp protease, protease subunit
VHIKKNLDPALKHVEFRTAPIIIYVNKFDESSLKDFTEKMEEAHNSGQTTIPIVIDSFGGGVYALMGMISLIKSTNLAVATIVNGKAMSCGAILAAFGDEGLRFAAPHATFLLHDVSNMAWGKLEELKASVNEAERLNTMIFDMLAEQCGKESDYFAKLLDEKKHADWFFGADEAKKHNIINKLKLPDLVCDVSVNFALK